MNQGFQAPRKRFGQHFLHDRQYLQRIVDAINPQAGDGLVEIGPGRGALTLPLLQRAGELIAIEIDRDQVAPLTELCAAQGGLDLRVGDALQLDFNALWPERRLRVVGNLPYNISTPLLFHLLDRAPRVHDMVFMLQWEVVERLAAPPGDKTYGRLSVMAQQRCDIHALFKVPPGAFHPPPKVQSAVVRLRPVPERRLSDAMQQRFATLVSAAFNQRRKTLANAIRQIADRAQIEQAGIDPGARAETLGVDAYLRLARLLAGGDEAAAAG